jgi:hypothetical protein
MKKTTIQRSFSFRITNPYFLASSFVLYITKPKRQASQLGVLVLLSNRIENTAEYE